MNITDQLAEALREAREELKFWASEHTCCSEPDYSKIDEAIAAYDARPKQQNEVDAIADLVADLDLIGFDDPEAPVSGADCVDVICQHIENLRSFAPL